LRIRRLRFDWSVLSVFRRVSETRVLPEHNLPPSETRARHQTWLALSAPRKDWRLHRICDVALQGDRKDEDRLNERWLCATDEYGSTAREFGDLPSEIVAAGRFQIARLAGPPSSKVLALLGIIAEVESRLKIYPSRVDRDAPPGGVPAKRPIGCTQATKIISTAGVTLSKALPQDCELATVYTAAITASAARSREARMLIDLLTAADQRELRKCAGFREPALASGGSAGSATDALRQKTS
jgi:hypothetical protein